MCGTRHGAGRFLRALATLAVAGLAVIPAGAAQAGQTLQVFQARNARLPGPAPQPGEWWFSKWDIRQQVWPLTQGAGVTVAVLDSGVQASVSSLQGAVVPGTVIGGSGNAEQDSDSGPRGHGTQMASLIAGRGGSGIAGIAPKAKILPVELTKELPVDATASTRFKLGRGSLDQLAAGISYSVSHGAQVINISGAAVSIASALGVSCGGDDTLQAAIDNAVAHNVVVVAASGNFSQEVNFPVVPASCPGVLAVGGVDQDGSWDQGADTGLYVAVAAPFNQETQGPDGKLYAPSGTSGAAALVSGEAALIRSRYPKMPWNEVVTRITSQVVDPPGWPVPSAGHGYGIPDIARAVDASRYPGEVVDPVGVSFEYNQLSDTAFGRQESTVTGPERIARAELLGGGALLTGGLVVVIVFGLRARRRRAGIPGAPRFQPGPAGYGVPGYGPAAPAHVSYGPPDSGPGYGPPGYGPAPASPQPYPGRAAARRSVQSRRRSTMVGVICGALAVVAGAILGVTSWGPALGPSVSASVLGGSACVAANSSSGDSGSLKFASPQTVCGLPRDTIASDVRWITTATSDQQRLLEIRNVSGMSGNHVTSRISGVFATPSFIGTYRQIYFSGYTGTFNPQPTLQLLMISDPGPKQVPAGPHGGVAQCYQQEFLMHCAWVTTTTAGEFWFFDGNAPGGASAVIGKNIIANFARIRDVLEVTG